MQIAITGSSGLIGSGLCSLLAGEKHRIIRLVRRAPNGSDEVQWDPGSGRLDLTALEGVDAVIHLAGENISSGRWTDARKKLIWESRVTGTEVLARSIAGLFDPPRVLISVSAVGYYGDRGAELLSEESKPGRGFLPELCCKWEAATQPAVLRGIRVVIPRIGMVLSSRGGALPLMLPVFRLGIGGKIADGSQYMSWIAFDDLVSLINYALHCESLHGPVNAVAPAPVTNEFFSRTLARVLAKPAWFVLPAFAARAAFGEMAKEVLLSGAKVSSAKIAAAGFKFKFPELETALRHVLQNSKA